MAFSSRWQRFSVLVQDGKGTLYMLHVRAFNAAKAASAGIRLANKQARADYGPLFKAMTGEKFIAEKVYHGHVQEAEHVPS